MNHSTIVWVHDDCLSPYNPALQAYPGAAAVFIWDDAWLAEWRSSLKRIVFIYECLLELPVTIRRGDPAGEIIQFAARHNADTVATTISPNPRFVGICARLSAQGLAVEPFDVEPFFKYSGRLDLKRFSRYWRVARKHVLK